MARHYTLPASTGKTRPVGLASGTAGHGPRAPAQPVKYKENVDAGATGFATILGLLIAGGAVAAGLIYGFGYLYSHR